MTLQKKFLNLFCVFYLLKSTRQLASIAPSFILSQLIKTHLVFSSLFPHLPVTFLPYVQKLLTEHKTQLWRGIVHRHKCGLSNRCFQAESPSSNISCFRLQEHDNRACQSVPYNRLLESNGQNQSSAVLFPAAKTSTYIHVGSLDMSWHIASE